MVDLWLVARQLSTQMVRSDSAGLSYHCVLCLLILMTPNYSGAVAT
jgi:hypothetical protein